MSRKSVLGRAVDGCRQAFVTIGLFSCVINLLMLTGPLFMLQVYDRVLSSGSLPTLIALFSLVVLLYLFMAILETVRSRMMVRIGQRFDENLKLPVFDAVFAQGLRGGIGVHSLRDLDQVRQFLSGPAPFAFFDAPWIPIYLAVIFALHSLLGWFAVVAGLILFVAALTNEAMTHKPLSDAAVAAEGAYRLAEDGHRQVDAITVMGMQSKMANQWKQKKEEALSLQSHASDRAGMISSASKAMRMLFQSGILALGAWLAIQQEISPGTMIAASIIMGRALAPIDQAIGQWQAFLSVRRSWEKLNMLLSKPTAAPVTTKLPAPTGELQVRNLTALPPRRISPNIKPIVQGISFDLPAGSGLGIIGPSGAGKSTLTKALLGIWPDCRGEVRLDGATYDQWDREELGKHIGYLPQDVSIMPGTLADNISRFDPDVSAEAIIDAATAADIHRLVLSFEEGYGTMIGPGGVQLSAGQRQRVALARALYGNPALVVLDEPNSNLDADGDIALTGAILSARERGATVIVVAHRPSAVSAVDMLLFLKNGQQGAFGSKTEVLKQVARPHTEEAAPKDEAADQRKSA